MGRTSAFLLRLCVIATALVMLILSVRAVRAQDTVPVLRGIETASESAAGEPAQLPQPPARDSVYGYKPGEGVSGHEQYAALSDAPPAAAAVAPRLDADYRLGPGDKVRVTVYGETDLSGDYQIDGAGIVRLPLIGALRAAGYTAPALEAGIGLALSKGYLKDPRVNVEIVTYRPFYIIGAVNRPGEYPYVEHISALNAVALAGGFAETAKQSTVYVRHEGSAVEEDVPTEQLSELRPGDTIRVKTTLFWQAMQIFTPLTPAVYAAAAIHY